MFLLRFLPRQHLHGSSHRSSLEVRWGSSEVDEQAVRWRELGLGESVSCPSTSGMILGECGPKWVGEPVLESPASRVVGHNV